MPNGTKRLRRRSAWREYGASSRCAPICMAQRSFSVRNMRPPSGSSIWQTALAGSPAGGYAWRSTIMTYITGRASNTISLMACRASVRKMARPRPSKTKSHVSSSKCQARNRRRGPSIFNEPQLLDGVLTRRDSGLKSLR